MDQPFGGVQVLLSGDFLQLPPVQAAAMAFESPTWQELKLQHVTLQQNFSDSVGRFHVSFWMHFQLSSLEKKSMILRGDKVRMVDKLDVFAFHSPQKDARYIYIYI